jgi:NTP pyrophosphatase (non-canonical NTP hydrolase)
MKDKITIEKYQELSKRTNVDLGSLLNNNLHMIMGISTESGEIVDVFKKHLAYSKEIDYINIKEEIGDLMFYIVNMCNINGWDLREILDTNIAKLEARYPEKFTEEQAIHRDLVAERQILEGATITQHINFAIDNQSIT